MYSVYRVVPKQGVEKHGEVRALDGKAASACGGSFHEEVSELKAFAHRSQPTLVDLSI
jgi:hypothetical protein